MKFITGRRRFTIMLKTKRFVMRGKKIRLSQDDRSAIKSLVDQISDDKPSNIEAVLQSKMLSNLALQNEAANRPNTLEGILGISEMDLRELPSIDFNPTEWINKFETSMSEIMMKAQTSAYVLGISGDTDSCVLGVLLANHAKKHGYQVIGVHLSMDSNDGKKSRVKLLKDFGICLHEFDVRVASESFAKSLRIQTVLGRANVMHGQILGAITHVARQHWNNLIVGTTQRTEFLMGDFPYLTTQGFVLPMLDIYKSQVYSLAKHLGLEKGIATRQPSPMMIQGSPESGVWTRLLNNFDDINIRRIPRDFYKAADPLYKLWENGKTPNELKYIYPKFTDVIDIMEYLNFRNSFKALSMRNLDINNVLARPKTIL